MSFHLVAHLSGFVGWERSTTSIFNIDNLVICYMLAILCADALHNIQLSELLFTLIISLFYSGIIFR